MHECRQLHQSGGIVGKEPVVDRMFILSSRPWLWQHVTEAQVAKGCTQAQGQLGSSLKHGNGADGDHEINDNNDYKDDYHSEFILFEDLDDYEL